MDRRAGPLAAQSEPNPLSSRASGLRPDARRVASSTGPMSSGSSTTRAPSPVMECSRATLADTRSAELRLGTTKLERDTPERMRWSVTCRPESYERVRSFLTSFRLLEAAGACEFVARSRQAPPAQSAQWWSALAASARTYRIAVLNAGHDAPHSISRWAETSACSHFADESARLSLEYKYWLDDVPGGRAYVAWLSGYIATAELDGHTAAEALHRCASIASDFLDASNIAAAPSLYEQLQLSANVLPRFLPVPQHPLRDMRRFALLPDCFPR